MRYVNPFLILFCATFLFTPAVFSSTVFVQSVDGMSWELLQTYKNSGELSKGFLGDKNKHIFELSVNGTGNTGPSHATAFTGITPERGGGGYNFLKPTSSFGRASSAFSEVAPVKHNNIVNRLKADGKSIACLNAPTINRNSQCDLHLVFKRRFNESCSVNLGTTSTLGDLNSCISEGESTFDVVSSTLKFNDISLVLGDSEVTLLCWKDDTQIKNRLLYRETIGGKDVLYVGPTHSINANPQFLEVASDFTCWPGVVDPTAARQGKISLAGFWAISKYQHDYSMALAQHIIGTEAYDVITNYTSFIDTLQHEMFVAKDHSHYREMHNFIVKGYQLVSDDLATISSLLEESDSMLVFSDHGVANSQNVVFFNGFLKSIGVDVESQTPQVKALTSGGLVHVYFSAGNEDLIQKVKIAMKQFSYKGQALFASIYDQSNFKSSDLNHKNSGAIVVIANEGFGFDPRLPPTSMFVYPSVSSPDDIKDTELSKQEYEFLLKGTPNRVSPGVHGFQSKHTNINGIVSAVGPIRNRLESTPNREIKDIYDLIVKASKASRK